MLRPGRHITLSFFQYPAGERLWGMRQMAEMRRPLQGVDGLNFYKLLGTGGGSGYDIWPDFGTYGLLGAWEDRAAADAFHQAHAAHRAFRDHSADIYTLHLVPLLSRGAWSGINPFLSESPAAEGPLAVLTRATIRPRYIIPFWRRVGGVARSLDGREGLLFTKGVGELPWVEQATFSVWRSERDMMAFAYGRGQAHTEAAARTRKANGFSEELYARFRVVEEQGTWKGNRPIADSTKA
jgi:heme-degrading monooxygenase HmoA